MAEWIGEVKKQYGQTERGGGGGGGGGWGGGLWGVGVWGGGGGWSKAMTENHGELVQVGIQPSLGLPAWS